MEKKQDYTLIVVGNGYDIALGYQTRYSDFYNSYKKILQNEDGVDNDNPALKDDEYKQLVVKHKDNFFIKYTLGINKIFDCWFDFENELSEVITTLDYAFSSLMTVSNRKGLYISEIPTDNMNLMVFDKNVVGDWYNYHFALFYTGKENLSIFNTTETKSPTITNEKLLVESLIKDIIDKLYKDLLDYELLLQKYLTIVTKASSKCVDIKMQGGIVVNYNYTSTANLLSKNVYNIHGSLEKQSIVLGVDDNLDLNIHQLEIFKKINRRSLIDNEYHLSDLSIGPISIAYFGLSFNSADSFTLKTLLESHRSVHTFYYYDDDSRKKIVSNLILLLERETYSKMYDGGYITFEKSSKAIVDL